jgi:hypothetical protein
MVDAGLAADGRVDLRQQRRGNLEERDAPLIDRRCKSRDVTDDAAAQRHHDGSAFGAQLEQAGEDVLQRLPVLVRFTVGNDHRFRVHAAVRKALPQWRLPVGGHSVIGDDHCLADGQPGQQRSGQPQRTSADMDRIGPLRERDLERPDVRFHHDAGS